MRLKVRVVLVASAFALANAGAAGANPPATPEPEAIRYCSRSRKRRHLRTRPIFLRSRVGVDHEGRRVVGAQRILQSLGDPMLGHTTIDGRPYYVRQMKNMKASMPVPFMTGVPFDFWAFLCGALLARAHARSGDVARIAGYCGEGETLDRALAEFAERTATRPSATTRSWCKRSNGAASRPRF